MLEAERLNKLILKPARAQCKERAVRKEKAWIHFSMLACSNIPIVLGAAN